MKTLFCLLLALTSIGCAAMTDELPWRTDYDGALEDATKEGKPVLLDFSATWCGPCRMMETTTFSDAGVKQLLRKYILVRVDFDKGTALVAKYHVQGIPALFVLNRFGETAGSAVGYRNPEQFTEWLNASSAEAFVTTSKVQAAKAKMEALDRDLHSPDATQRQRGVSQVLESYATKDEAAPASELILKGLVAERPGDLLPQLNDQRLAVRILVGNLLAQKLGSGFEYDPWDAKETRMATVQAWTQKLGAPAEAREKSDGASTPKKGE